MKARFKAGELATAVGLMAHVVDRSQVQRYPHLGGLVVEADAGIVRLQAGDLDVSAEATVPAEVVEAGHVTLALAELSGLIKGFPEDAPLTISGSTLSAARSRYRLPGLPAGERPERLTVAPDTPALTLTAGDIVGLLTDTSAAAAKEVTRAYLRGIYLHAVGPQLRAVATDGVTLVRSDIAAPAGSANFAALIPGRAAALLLRLAKLNDGELTLRADAHVLSVAGDGRAFTSRLNSGRYPDYRRIIPQPSDRWVEVGRREFKGALQRLSAISGTGIVSFRWSSERTRLQLGLPLEGTATDELDAAALSGRAKAAYSLGRLSTLLDAFGGNRIRLDINGQEQPVLLTDPNDPALLGLLTAIRCPPADPAEHVA